MDEYNKEKDLEERVKLLEEKVITLEGTIKIMQQRKKKPTQPSPVPIQKTLQPYSKENPKPSPKPKQKENKLGEVVVGKYFIGVLAALLIFIAAVSLVSLIWATLTPTMRLGLIVGVGALLTSLGFVFIKKYKNPITAIVLGTGAGLLFIGILSANMYFNVISSTTAIVLAGIWAVFFILSYKYTQMFFTTVIAYIGSFIALLLGLTLIVGLPEYMVLMMFVTGISIVLIVTSNKWLSINKQIISILLVLLSFITLLIGGLSVNTVKYESIKVILFIVLAVVFIVQNYLFKKTDTKGRIAWYLGVNFIVNMLTLGVFTRYFSYQYDLGGAVLCFILINTVQMVYLEYTTKEIRKLSVLYYTVIQVIPVILLQSELFDIGVGLSLIYLVLIVLQILKDHNDYIIPISFLIVFDALLLAISADSIVGLWDRGNPIIMPVIYGLVQIIVVSYLLYKNYKGGVKQNFVLLKIAGFITYAFNIAYIPYMIVYKLTPVVTHTVTGMDLMTIPYLYTGQVVAFFSLCLFICIIAASGYMKDWWHTDFKWFNRLDNIKQDKTYFVFYIVTLIALNIGLSTLTSMNLEIFLEVLLVLLGLVVVALIQSSNLIKYYKNYKLVGVWIGLKYLILTWVILGTLADLSFESVLVSVSGLVVALLSIILGFKINIKSLRLYGLIVTVLMVLKFIVIDLNQENSITRVIALLIGGLICFGITVLYNKLNKEVENS